MSDMPKKLTQREAIDVRDGLEGYIVYHGGIHDDGCPKDDTYDYSGKPMNDAANAACRLIDRLVVLEALLGEVAALPVAEISGCRIPLELLVRLRDAMDGQ